TRPAEAGPNADKGVPISQMDAVRSSQTPDRSVTRWANFLRGWGRYLIAAIAFALVISGLLFKSGATPDYGRSPVATIVPGSRALGDYCETSSHCEAALICQFGKCTTPPVSKTRTEGTSTGAPVVKIDPGSRALGETCDVSYECEGTLVCREGT